MTNTPFHALIRFRWFIIAVAIGVIAASLGYAYFAMPLTTQSPSKATDAGNGPIQSNNENISITQFEHKIRTQFSIDDYKAQLTYQEQAILSVYDSADLVERVALERELGMLRVKIETHTALYEDKIKLLLEIFKSLQNSSTSFPVAEYHAALSDLLNGNTLSAYVLFSRLESDNRNATELETINLAGEAAYMRGRIALDQIDYRKAYRHYRHAVMYNPKNIVYLLAAGNIAESIALYGNAILYYEAALHLQKSSPDNSPNHLRIHWLNLGSAWNSKGDPDKAIEFFTLALSSDLDTYDASHVNVAADKNFLGLAWENKGMFSKAIAYYQQALIIYKNQLGLNHSTTLQIMENIERTTKQLERA